jgi:hypothetical protein
LSKDVVKLPHPTFGRRPHMLADLVERCRLIDGQLVAPRIRSLGLHVIDQAHDVRASLRSDVDAERLLRG